MKNKKYKEIRIKVIINQNKAQKVNQLMEYRKVNKKLAVTVSEEEILEAKKKFLKQRKLIFSKIKENGINKW